MDPELLCGKATLVPSGEAMAMDTHREKPLVRAIFLLLLLSICFGVLVGRVAGYEVCDINTKVLRGQQHIFTKNSWNTSRSQITLFGKVEDSFEGFSVKVEGIGGIDYGAWFPADDQCFPNKTIWYQLITFALIKNNSTTIMFGFETKYCRRECERNEAPQSLQQHSVVVHGASQWNNHYPYGDCIVAKPSDKTFSGPLLTCTSAAPPAPMSTVTIIVIVMAVVVGVV
ncbi:uncharacterized protein LOC123498873 isoform X2 [Portunus trituberculatus]|nr:uncharacterized protein LOC123498873 isoform X2 [Portunus trituberculatus]XP_045102303.1 uncharacterized protein LOC123498873 isoform X2 [Portunus trituberculatus]